MRVNANNYFFEKASEMQTGPPMAIFLQRKVVPGSGVWPWLRARDTCIRIRIHVGTVSYSVLF